MRKALLTQRTTLRAINPADLEKLIDRDVPITRIMAIEDLRKGESFLANLPNIDIDMLVEVIDELEPALGRVMGTDEGRDWLEKQQGIIRGL